MPLPRKNDFLVKREEKAVAAASGEGGTFTYFSPEGSHDARERHRLLVVREEGDRISVHPTSEARFKVGLTAWRWTEREGGKPETFRVVKTTPTRVDLSRE